MKYGMINWYICMIILFFNFSKLYSSIVTLLLNIVFNMGIMIDLDYDKQDFIQII